MSSRRYVGLAESILDAFDRLPVSSMKLHERVQATFGLVDSRTFYRRLRSLHEDGLIVISHTEPHGRYPRVFYVRAPKTVSPSR